MAWIAKANAAQSAAQLRTASPNTSAYLYQGIRMLATRSRNPSRPSTPWAGTPNRPLDRPTSQVMRR
jgi:hypothetical protein